MRARTPIAAPPRRRIRPLPVVTLPVVTLAVAALLLLAACGGGTAPDADASRSAALVQRGTFERELLLTGQLEAVRSISIKAPQTALFQMRIQYLAEEGTAVQAGDPLLDFDNSSRAAQVQDLETRILDAQAQLAARRSELASALKDLEIELATKEHAFALGRLRGGVDPEVLSRKVYSERQLELEKATRELKETKERSQLTRQRGQADIDVLAINQSKLEQDLLAARRDIELLSIKAPGAGLVVHERRHDTNLRYQEGDSCWPGQGILRLPDLDDMQVAFDVNEVDGPFVTEGMPVQLTLDAFPGRAARGTITQVPSMAVKRNDDSSVSVFKVVATLEETWVGEMKPGMSVLGRVVVDRQESVPLVARAAVSCSAEDCHVDVPTRRGRPPRRVTVTPLQRNATSYLLSEEDAARIESTDGA